MKKEKMKKKNWKKNIILFLIIILLAVVITVTVIILKNKKVNNIQDNNVQDNNETEDGQPNYGLIDMNNTENAKITDELKENVSENVLKDRKIDGLEISNIKLYAKDGTSYFSALVKNDTGTDFEGKVAKIGFINKEGKEYDNLEIYVPIVKNEDINMINSSTTADITNAFDITIEFE